MKKEQLLNIMKALANNEVVEAHKKDLVNLHGDTNTPRITRLLDVLEKQGYITTIEKTKNLGRGKWTPYKWKINETINIFKDNRCDNVKLTDVTNKNINDYENVINIFNYQQKKFNNIDIDVIDTEYGRVIPVSNIYNALGLSRQAIHQMLDRNKELFNGMVFNINMGDGDKICVNKEGIIGLLMKMQYERLKEDKKQLVLQFQKWCMKTLSEIVSNGKVELKDQERQEVKNNMRQAIGLNDEDIDKLFGDIEELLHNKLHTLHSVVNELKDEKNNCKMMAESEKQRSERLIAKTVELREKIYSVR
ncbi:hypothetical protein IRP63_14040 (plasmid) [Clostridium botulinum]|uniref:Bro-N domain-containing protein n=1 Tax=Clostridium botulinum C/D str. DC5 TaxID=1443128 RepID=A0A0A0HYR2_CLOBO|nr:phage antirepressor N-terminal domain-containing protein [Clostridium botulinum]KGM93573.1 hypothetical protein Z955_14730 [Clostridium botulinum C/D str. DC5]KOC56884.1 hypothetical protein ADU89_01425 [Clostridium botulinum]KOC57359.1 hypothetical protein ADU90_05965 [Clostridium botulinum]MCD3232593.1 hypothetical protein [Clostridium botulinum D/C]MCD3238478.1 hypothetical protein [Clostridium botulinum D/C]